MPLTAPTITPTVIIPPYEETVVRPVRLRVGAEVRRFGYALELLTVVDPLGVVAGVNASAIVPVYIPASTITVAALAPSVNLLVGVTAPATTMTLAAPIPAVATGTSVAVPLSTVSVAALAPDSVGPNVDPYFSSVSVLLHANGTNGSTTFTDSSSNALTVTATGTAQVSTTASKFGGASAYFNGSSDALTFTDPALGTGDFTIEMWLKTASGVQYAQLVGNETGGGSSGFTFLINNNSSTGGQLAVYCSGFSMSSATGDWSDDAWHHIALTRSGTSLKLWGDGVNIGTGTSSASFSGTATMYVGRNNVFTPRNMVGYMDELRITKGVARYTGTFTPPAAPFPDA